MYEFMRAAGFSPQRPHSRHVKGDEAAKEQFKTLTETLRHAERLRPWVSLWTMDEHRIGLYPNLQRMKAPTGQPLVCPVYPRYEWLYMSAFVCPESGHSHFWLMPEVSSPEGF